MMRRGVLVIIGLLIVLALGVALSLALLQLDAGDNACGNLFVSRTHNIDCTERLNRQRVAAGLWLTGAAVGALVLWRCGRSRSLMPRGGR